jgi:H+/Cl- antiporter ClcA
MASMFRHFGLLRSHQWFSPPQWKRRLLLWTGAVAVGLATTVFIKGCIWAFDIFGRVLAHGSWWPLVITPCTLALLAYLTSGKLRATRGSGIPQAIASLHVEDEKFRFDMLSLRVAAGKMALTFAALLGGASVGREGPTVHVGASLMYSIGRRFGFAEPTAAGRFVLAGSAAGLAAAFNAPLAGVVFAIEEMAGAYEDRMSGAIMTAVIIGGIITLGLLGNYSYFGTVHAALTIKQGWLAVLLCGVLCGMAGGLFSRIILLSGRVLSRIAALRSRSPVAFAFGCGLVLALLGLASGNAVYGTGYEQARAILQHGAHPPSETFGAFKFLANVVSYWSGIPGGLFSPALAVGAGFGRDIAHLVPGAPVATVALLGMAGYLTGVTQSPLTATVITMEMTANQAMVIPILAVCLIARAASALFCKKPVYHAFSEQLEAEYEAKRKAAKAEAAHGDQPAAITPPVTTAGTDRP